MFGEVSLHKDPNNKVLCCMCGGGMPAIETMVGYLRAIYEKRGNQIIDYATGGSAGALIGSLIMSWNQDIDKLEYTIKNTNIDDWFKACYFQLFKSVFSLSNYFMDNTGLFNFLNKELTLDAYDKVTVSATQYDGNKIGKGILLPGSPANTTASMSIQMVFPPVRLEDGFYYGDGGVRNLCPLGRYLDLPKYKHVYILLVPESEMTSYNFKWKFLGKGISLLNTALEREVSQIVEMKLGEASNITVLRVPKYVESAGLLSWSNKFEQIDLAYKYALNELYMEDNNA